jgi:hypothetical protein
MLSVELAELRPDLAKSALHFEYESVEFGCFVRTIVALARPGCAYTHRAVRLMSGLLLTARFYQHRLISVNRSIVANILYSSPDSANRQDAKVAKISTERGGGMIRKRHSVPEGGSDQVIRKAASGTASGSDQVIPKGRIRYREP